MKKKQNQTMLGVRMEGPYTIERVQVNGNLATLLPERIRYGARVGGPKYYAVNLILRLFLYHFLHMMSS